MKKTVCSIVCGLGLLYATWGRSPAGITENELEWKPVPGKIMTRWGKELSPEPPHPEYPRPQLVRSEWLNLNGLWDYAVRPAESQRPEVYDGRILVPFPIQSALSGVGRTVKPDERLWYRTSFRVPREWRSRRVMLNFEAVDWEVTVWVNGREVGSHRGGYNPFSCDVTDALLEQEEQEITAWVWDPTDEGFQPRGKQVLDPHGIWYTAVTGIWGTVWLEPVHPTFISGLDIAADPENGTIRLRAELTNPTPAHGLAVAVLDGDRELAVAGGPFDEELVIRVPGAVPWSPDVPQLYDLRIKVENGLGEDEDAVTSYCGLRRISLEPDSQGIPRLCLNGRPIFFFGPLDQGWWPDGLYTPPTDEALRYDLEVIRRLGMNMLRKHVKIESRRFYYWCDKMGVMVWQDMPSGDRSIGRRNPDLDRRPESAGQFRLELRRMIDTLGNHPSIVMWVPFNEGWGQFDSEAITEWIHGYDPSRLVDTASGWADRGVGDVSDIHAYPGPSAPPNEQDRAAVLGEFGGLGLPVAGHTWQDEKNWGYRSYKSREELTDAYLALIERLAPLIEKGLCAAIYTQTSDVEIEVNGLLTYDRDKIKMDEARVREANLTLYSRIR